MSAAKTPAERAAELAERRRVERQRKAAELLADEALPRSLAELLASEVLAGRCACGCRTPIDGGNVRTFYVGERHRKSAHRRRLEYLAEAAGVPARLSRRSLEEGTRTPERPADAPRRRPRRKTGPRPGVTLYLPSVEVAIALAVVMGDLVQLDTTPELGTARDALEAALERRRRREAA